MKEGEKKEGLLKRQRNIEDKNEEQPKAFSTASKVSGAA